MPSFSEDNAAHGHKKPWYRNLIVASPNPHRLPGGHQIDQAPMCPCLACWESGASYHGAPDLRLSHEEEEREEEVKEVKHENVVAEEEKKQVESRAPSFEAPTIAPPAATYAPLFRKNLFKHHHNGSFESIASDMRPLRKSSTVSSTSSTAYEVEY